MANKVDEIVAFLHGKFDIKPHSTGIILSSNFGDFLDIVENKQEIMFKDIPSFKILDGDKEKNKLVFGSIRGRNVIVSFGRLHFNFGYSHGDIANYIFILKELGCDELIITASLGSLNRKIKVGDVITATDQINLSNRNPLFDCEYNKYGHQFIDMVEPYDTNLIDLLSKVGKERMGIKVKKGVIVETAGPSLETVSESKFARQIGGDFLAFYICNEVIASKYCGLPVVLYGLITNYASYLSASKIKHEDVVHNRKLASKYYLKLLERFIGRIEDLNVQ